MKKSILLGFALVAVLSSTVMGQIYRTTDAEGNVIFTDTPPPGGAAEKVQLQHTNTAEPTPVPEPKAAEPELTVEPAMPEQVVRIVSPAHEETIPVGGAGNFSVTARVEPPLAKGQAMRLLMDGTPTGKLQPSGFWDLTNVDRGAHDLAVEVVDSEGVITARSAAVTVYVRRASVN